MGQNADIAGCGFSRSHYEIHGIDYNCKESIIGHGGGTGLSIYHLSNPGQLIPQQGMIREIALFITSDETNHTESRFILPANQGFL